MFARLSYKQRALELAPTATAGSALIGAFNEPEKDAVIDDVTTWLLAHL